MAQNRSSAVMQQRREPSNSLDDFPTPPWATRALCEWLGPRTCTMSAREPAANRGYMAGPLMEYFYDVEASDIFDYGVGLPVRNFLHGAFPETVDWTISNPPFNKAQSFIDRALQTSRGGVAMFVRSTFTESIGRYRDLYSVTPPTDILQFVERVVLRKGRLVDPDVKERVWSKKEKKYVWRSPSTSTAYCWMVWDKAAIRQRPAYDWIAPCRKRLTREGDYDER